MADELNVLNEALYGLGVKYKEAFKSFVEPLLALGDSAFDLIYDDVEGQNRTRAYIWLRENFDDFQRTYLIAGFELGKATYLATRMREAENAGVTPPEFPGVDLSPKLVSDNVNGFWALIPLLKKVVEGSYTLDMVSSIASKGVADLSRAASLAAGAADTGVKKVARIQAAANECDFCKDQARRIKDLSKVKAGSLNFHKNCHCVIVFDYTFN